MAVAVALLAVTGVEAGMLVRDWAREWRRAQEQEVALVTETEWEDVALPVGFEGCEMASCSALPYSELEDYQELLMASLEKTRSQKLLVNLALTYYYRGDEASYEKYLGEAQAMDPSERWVQGEVEASVNSGG
jgi:hypothetical protein